MSPETSVLLSKHKNKAQDKVPTGTHMSVSTSSWMQDEQNSLKSHFDVFISKIFKLTCGIIKLLLLKSKLSGVCYQNRQKTGNHSTFSADYHCLNSASIKTASYSWVLSASSL